MKQIQEACLPSWFFIIFFYLQLKLLRELQGKFWSLVVYEVFCPSCNLPEHLRKKEVCKCINIVLLPFVYWRGLQIRYIATLAVSRDWVNNNSSKKHTHSKHRLHLLQKKPNKQKDKQPQTTKHWFWGYIFEHLNKIPLISFDLQGIMVFTETLDKTEI